jgi:hypothetical protein
LSKLLKILSAIPQDILNGKKDQLIKHRVAELQDKYQAHLRKAHEEIEANFVCGDWQTTRGKAIKILQRQLADLGGMKVFFGS